MDTSVNRKRHGKISSFLLPPPSLSSHSDDEEETTISKYYPDYKFTYRTLTFCDTSGSLWTESCPYTNTSKRCPFNKKCVSQNLRKKIIISIDRVQKKNQTVNFFIDLKH